VVNRAKRGPPQKGKEGRQPRSLPLVREQGNGSTTIEKSVVVTREARGNVSPAPIKLTSAFRGKKKKRTALTRGR